MKRNSYRIVSYRIVSRDNLKLKNNNNNNNKIHTIQNHNVQRGIFSTNIFKSIKFRFGRNEFEGFEGGEKGEGGASRLRTRGLFLHGFPMVGRQVGPPMDFSRTRRVLRIEEIESLVHSVTAGGSSLSLSLSLSLPPTWQKI